MFSKKLFILLCLLFSTIYFSPKPTFAASNFKTDYRVTYTAQENETTKVVMTVTLTNQTTQFYASSYKMQLGFSDVTNLTASDPEGPLSPKISKTSEGNLLDLTFNKKAVGQGDKLTFMLTFDTKEVTKKHGKVWEINVPGIANPEEFNTFTVDVKVPSAFGTPTYIKPAQPQHTLTFTKNQLGMGGISIAFGKEQLYAFDLQYHLKNKNLFPITTEIALPPTTNYQEVYLSSIEPQPKNVRVDQDGNWLAEFYLLPTQKLDVNVNGDVAVGLSPKQQELSLEEYALYTRPMQYWEAGDPTIMDLAQQLKTPQAIYDYVVKTLKYDFQRVTQSSDRLGAVNAINSPKSAVCREFTDLFIALARAAGIPARELNGYAYSENPRLRPLSMTQDILHAWPEYYDKEKKTWVMVDPTWGSTTGGTDYFKQLDNDHVVFAVKGIDSNKPIPAGAYKLTKSDAQKDVAIGFSDGVSHTEPEITFTPEFPETAVAGLPIKGHVIVKNTGSGMAPAQIFTVSSTDLSPSDQVYQFPAIPPFGSVSIPVSFTSPSLLTNKDAGLTIRYTPIESGVTGQSKGTQAVLGEQTAGSSATSTEYAFRVAPIYMTGWGIGGFIAISAISISVFAAKSGRLRLPRKK